MRLTERYEDFDIDDVDYKNPVIKHRVVDHSTDYEEKLGQYEDIDESPEHLAKVKRAFDIIREKKIDTEKLCLVANAYAYNNFGKVAVIPITQEEYDLLNEVLYEKETS